jgi:signal transduction histidine kinase
LGGLVVYLTGGFFLAGLIMLPLASLSVQTLSPGKAALVCALVIVTLIVSYGLQAGWIVALSDGVGYLAGVLFVVFASRMAVRERETRVMAEALAAELEAGNRQLRRYAAQAEELAVTRERARLAAELHDSVGHSLTALDVQLALLVWLPPEQRAPRQAAVEQAQILVKQGLADLRRAVQALAPAALETFSLPEAITELTRDAGLPLDWQTEGKIIPLPPQTALPLYRAAQEALTNVQRHAPAALRVTMRLRYTPEAVSLSVENKGGSASPKVPAFRQGYGLRGLRRRAGALGGDFYAEPTPSGGFRLEMTLPVPGHG